MFIAPAKDFEQKFRTYRRERHIAQFIDTQKLDFSYFLLQGTKPFLVAHFHQFMSQNYRRRAGDAVSCSDRQLTLVPVRLADSKMP